MGASVLKKSSFQTVELSSFCLIPMVTESQRQGVDQHSFCGLVQTMFSWLLPKPNSRFACARFWNRLADVRFLRVGLESGQHAGGWLI